MRFSSRPFLLILPAVLGILGCSILPFYKHVNTEASEEPDEPVGTYNTSLNVPWYYDFSDVSVDRAAACRRFLTRGVLSAESEAKSCEGIPQDRNFVALTISGGGGRSAALGAAVIMQLERIGVLKHVDVISAVSGGAQAAALYSLTYDQDDAATDGAIPDRYILKPDDPVDFVGIFDRNLTTDWMSSLLMPWHLGPYLVTYFDRTDVMADTYADNYFPRGGPFDINWGMRFRDINPKRPSLLVNATDMTLRHNSNEVPSGIAGGCFVFSYEGFRLNLISDLHGFPISQAVMASAAYPGMFNYMSIRDYGRSLPNDQEAYVHLADGGIRDHLALVPINAMLRRFAAGQPLAGIEADDVVRSCEFSRGTLNPARSSQGVPPTSLHRDPYEVQPLLPDRILLIIVDAARPPQGYPEDDPDPRATLFDRVVPVSKVIDSVDATLDDQRALRIVELLTLRRHLTGQVAIERGIRSCLKKRGGAADALANCLVQIKASEADRLRGVYGPDCCPVIGMGVHDFTKFADQQFGPLNAESLNIDQAWGVDHITLECLEDNNFGGGRHDSHYAKVRRMSIGLSLYSDELASIREAADALVEAMHADFCDPQTRLFAGVPGIACTPPPVHHGGECRSRITGGK